MYYLRVLWTFARNSIVRELTFRGNFLITAITRAFWFGAQLFLFEMIYRQVPTINTWTKYEFYAFLATSMIINTLIEALFMPNIAQFSELIRTGNLDFVLLKPIDTQFLISLEKLDLGTLSHLALSGGLLSYSLSRLDSPVSLAAVGGYLLLLLVGVAFFYSLMLILASTSILFGRNQGLYDFWFYITIFARYPQDIYTGSPLAEVLSFVFTYLIPVLLVVTVPARTLLNMPLDPRFLAASVVMTTVSLLASRMIFQWSLRHYRSASS